MNNVLNKIKKITGFSYYQSLNATATDSGKQSDVLAFMFAAFACFMVLSGQFGWDGEALKIDIPILALCYFVGCTCRAKKGAGASLMPSTYKQRVVWAVLSPALAYLVIAAIFAVVVCITLLIIYVSFLAVAHGTEFAQEVNFIYDADYTSDIGAYGKIYELCISVYYSSALIFFSYIKKPYRRWLALAGSLAVGEGVNLVLANAANGFNGFVSSTYLASDIADIKYPIIAVAALVIFTAATAVCAVLFAVNREKPKTF